MKILILKSLITDFIKIKLLSQINAQVSAAALASSKKMSSSAFSQYVMSIADLYDMARLPLAISSSFRFLLPVTMFEGVEK